MGKRAFSPSLPLSFHHSSEARRTVNNAVKLPSFPTCYTITVLPPSPLLVSNQNSKKRKYRHGKRDGEKAKKNFPRTSSIQYLRGSPLKNKVFSEGRKEKLHDPSSSFPPLCNSISFGSISSSSSFSSSLSEAQSFLSIGGFGFLEVLPAHTNRLLPVIGLALPPFSLACQYKSSLTEETGAQLGGGRKKKKSSQIIHTGSEEEELGGRRDFVCGQWRHDIRQLEQKSFSFLKKKKP